MSEPPCIVRERMHHGHDSQTVLKNEIADSNEVGRVQPFERGSEGVQNGQGGQASMHIPEVLDSYAFFEVGPALDQRQGMDTGDEKEEEEEEDEEEEEERISPVPGVDVKNALHRFPIKSGLAEA